MRKRNIHQSRHPFDKRPFEAFYCGSWKNVERLRIRAGAVSMLLVDGGNVFEENVPISNLRIKSRKAISSDCTCYLRPGLDVCVLSTFQLTQGSSEEENVEPVWLDAKINYVERRPHEPKCACQFYVSFYLTQGPLGLMMKALNKDIIKVQIDQISIIQMLEWNPCDNEHYRWDFSQDCSSLQKYKFLSGKFSSDLSWLLVASVVKKIEFNVRSIRNRIVYQILDDDYDQHPSNLKGNSNAVNFKIQNGVSVPIIVPFTQTDIPEKGTGCDVHDDDSLSFYELMGLRRSKRRHIQPERFLACDLSNLDIDAARIVKYRTYRREYEEMPLELPIQADHASYLDEHSKGYKRVHSYRKDYMENFLGCQSKIKSREAESAVSSRREHQLQHANQRKHQYQRLIVPVLDETDLMVKSAGSSQREHQLQLANQNKQQSQPPIVPVLGETDSMVKSAESSQREHQPQLANQRKHQSQRDMLPVLDETDQMDHEKDPLDAQIPGNSGEISEIVSNDVSINGIPIKHRKNTSDEGGRERKGLLKKFPRKRDCSIFSGWGGFGVAGTNGRQTFSSSLYKEMISRCMHNIKSTIVKEQPPVIDQWNKIRAANYLNERDTIGIPSMGEEENSEIGMLWKEMELCVASTYILEDSEGSNAEVPLEAAQNMGKHCGQVCQHEYKLNEEIGILCQLCGSVSTEIKYVSPTFLPRTSWIPNKVPSSEEDSEHKLDEGDLFCIPGASDTPLSEGEDNVWALIPDFKRKLRFHQKRAFEFLWRNIAGSLVPTLMESTVKKRGGCVISHSPGAGKTLLIIAFLVSYLELFPGSRPLVLAPKSTLYTWYKETIKWEIPIPVYPIHGGSTYKSEVSRQKLRASPGDPKPNQNFLHVLDCMNKIQKWLEHPSILIMGYTSFLAMTRECSKFAHRQYMARVLQQNPGILILDEGHNPRNTTSRLRKGLMKVETRLRILLSGTLFQNNFGEYFNTLTLARPSFVNEVLRELDPKFKRRKADAKISISLENRARKLFDKIAKKIDSSVAEERMQSLNVLRNLTSGFIDVYEGGSSENLPGLQCYTLMMKSTPYQEKLLKKIENQRSRYKGFPLELELLITLGAIHPWLVRTAACADQFLSGEELKIVDKHKFDLKFGSKVRFVMSLVPRCLIRKEKVLVFCHNISPINLFLEMFESFYGWRKGEEVLVLRGDVELFERGRVMDKFEEPGGASKIMLASIRACAEGISLTAASRVILLDSEWNPSKTKQAIARAFRPGQAKVVYVYQLLAAGTLEEEKYGKTTWKEWVSSMMFSEEEEHVEDPSQCQAEKIEDDVLREIVEEDRAKLFHKILKIEKASNGVTRK